MVIVLSVLEVNNVSIYRFVECGTFSVTVEVEASSEEEALELIEDGQGTEVDGSLEYYDSSFELQEIIE